MLAECLLTLLERLLCFELTLLVGVNRHGPVSIALLVLFLGRFGGAGSRLVLLPFKVCRGLFEQNARDAEVNKGNEKEIIITILSFLYLLSIPTVTADCSGSNSDYHCGDGGNYCRNYHPSCNSRWPSQ